MDKNEKTEKNEKKKGVLLTRFLMGGFIVLFYLSLFLVESISRIDAGLVPLALLGSYGTALVFTGIRAKQLGRSGPGWVFGGFFSGLISSIVLFFIGKKPGLILEEQYKKKLEEASSRKVERAILACAKTNKGFVSVSNAALEANISMEEAQKVLDELVRKGYAQMEVKSSGVLMYTFPDFIED
jgi:predicted transcriptional regulator